MYKTFAPKGSQGKILVHINCKEIDDPILGRVVSDLAKLLKGKMEPYYSPNVISRYRVFMSNADKIRLTGNKEETKVHNKHTGYIGGIKTIPYNTMTSVERVILALQRMFSKGPQRNEIMGKNIRIFAKDLPDNLSTQKMCKVTLGKKGFKVKENNEL